VTTCETDGAELVDAAVFAAADRDMAPGEQIGEYRIESKLGQGGFGTVYRAVHPVIGKTVAVKVLSRRFSSDPEMVSRFIAEARAVNRIQNKNIIDIFAFGALPDGRQYYVMELLGGLTLDQHIEERGYLSPEEAMPILVGIARALDAAHAAGIVHRDLKPENVFLVFDEDRGLSPKLLDFGIAKLFGEVSGEHRTRTGVPLGTPYYMSPEQCRGRSVDHRTDIYSFGVLCYQVLTGTLPFTGDSFMDVMMRHVSDALPPVSARSPTLAPAFDQPIAHMMAKNPAERPPSVSAAVEELADAARSAGHSVERPAKRSGPGASGQVTPYRPAFTPTRAAALESADTLAQATTAAGDTLPHAIAPPRRRALPLVIGGAVVVAVAVLALVSGVHRARPEPPPASSVASSPTPPSAEPVPVLSAAAPAPPVASVSAAPALPARIQLSVQSVPKHVVVYLGERKLGIAPGPISLDRGTDKLALVLKADGYRPRTVTFTPSENGVISATLQKIIHHTAPPPATRKPRTPSDLEF